jgi:hypothetical protein
MRKAKPSKPSLAGAIASRTDFTHLSTNCKRPDEGAGEPWGVTLDAEAGIITKRG